MAESTASMFPEITGSNIFGVQSKKKCEFIKSKKTKTIVRETNSWDEIRCDYYRRQAYQVWGYHANYTANLNNTRGFANISKLSFLDTTFSANIQITCNFHKFFYASVIRFWKWEIEWLSFSFRPFSFSRSNAIWLFSAPSFLPDQLKSNTSFPAICTQPLLLLLLPNFRRYRKTRAKSNIQSINDWVGRNIFTRWRERNKEGRGVAAVGGRGGGFSHFTAIGPSTPYSQAGQLPIRRMTALSQYQSLVIRRWAIFYAVQKRRPTDFEAQNLWKGRSGGKAIAEHREKNKSKRLKRKNCVIITKEKMA